MPAILFPWPNYQRYDPSLATSRLLKAQKKGPVVNKLKNLTLSKDNSSCTWKAIISPKTCSSSRSRSLGDNNTSHTGFEALR